MSKVEIDGVAYEVVPEVAGLLQVVSEERDELKKLKRRLKMSNQLTASEAIFGFCAWLTSRKERTVMSGKDNAAPIVELIKTFCDKNNLEVPRENYTDYLSMPD